MTKKSVYCDHCGDLIRSKDHAAIFASPKRGGFEVERLDFCDDCFFKVISFAKKRYRKPFKGG